MMLAACRDGRVGEAVYESIARRRCTMNMIQQHEADTEYGKSKEKKSEKRKKERDYEGATAILRGGRAGGFGFAGGVPVFELTARGGDAGTLS